MPFPPLIHHTEVIKNIPVFFSRKKVSVTASKPIISLLEVETLLQGKPSYLSFHTKTDIYSTVLSLADKRSSAVDRWNRIKKTCRPQCVKVASVIIIIMDPQGVFIVFYTFFTIFRHRYR